MKENLWFEPANGQGEFPHAFWGTRIDMLPEHWFTPSVELRRLGWPDFTPTALADWDSSASPSPDEPDDCCVVLCFPRTVQPLEHTGGWVLALHECGGIWNEPKRIIVKQLPITARGREIAHGLARSMAHSNVSAQFALFDQLIEYRRALNDLGLDCNQHIQSLAEGFYPIDLTSEALAVLEVTSIPLEAMELMESETMCLAILAPNCSEC